MTMERLTHKRANGIKEGYWSPNKKQELVDTAKEPIKDTNSGVRYTGYFICPNCRKHFTGTRIAKFCYHCGQRIKWEER